MTNHRCHRCGSELHPEAEGTLLFCWHCGAPQVTLSEDLQEQADKLREEENNPAAAEASHKLLPAPGAVDWKRAIGLSALVTFGTALLTVLLPPLVALIWMWAPLIPAIVIAIYTSRHRDVRFNARIGARLGIVCGVLLVAGLGTIGTARLDASRFLLKDMASWDSQVTASLAKAKAQATADRDPQTAKESLDEFNALSAIPEFRAGVWLCVCGVLAGILLLLTGAGGAFAGSLRSRRRAV